MSKILDFRSKTLNVSITFSFLLIFCASLLTCQDKKTKSTTPIDEFCNEFYKISNSILKKMFECIFGFSDFPLEGLETVNCSQESYFGILKKSIELGRAKFNPDLASSCLNSLKEISGWSCEELAEKISLSQDIYDIAGENCEEVIQGMREVGQDCYIYGECTKGAYCEGDSCPGTCNPLPKEGEDCSLTDECAEGLVCVDRICQKPSKIGEKCFEDSDCEKGLFCEQSSHIKITSTCKPAGQKELGEDCKSDQECKSNLCIDKCIEIKFASAEGAKCGLINNTVYYCLGQPYCELTSEVTGECRKRKKEGESCEPIEERLSALNGLVPNMPKNMLVPNMLAPNRQVKSFLYSPKIFPKQWGGLFLLFLLLFDTESCSEGLYCDKESRICKKLPAEGERCAESFFQCDYSLQCDDGICRGRKKIGETCTSSSECEQGLFCSTSINQFKGECTELKPKGERCYSDHECKNENCRNNICCGI